MLNVPRSKILTFYRTPAMSRRSRILRLLIAVGRLTAQKLKPSHHLAQSPQTSSHHHTRDLKAVRPSGSIKSYDGLRGVACVIVYNFHYLYPYTRTNVRGFAVGFDPANNRNPHQLPFLCLLVRGRAMVTLFFGISGYVLSYHYLSAVRDREWQTSHRRLASLALRRWARLYIPATISMLIIAVMANIGAFEAGREFQESDWLTGAWEEHPPRFSSFGAQLKDYFGMWWKWSSPWTWMLYFNSYDPHTWTIPVEFRCSLVVFVMLLAASHLKQLWRYGLTILICIYCFACNRWDVAIFVGGSFVADLHLHTLKKHQRNEDILPHHVLLRKPGLLRSVSHVAATAVFTAGLYLLSFPDEMADKTPGFSTFDSITPSGYTWNYTFWHSLGGILVVWAIEVLPPLQRFFASRVPQYLGKISFALYLVHGPILHSAGFVLQPKIWQAIGHDTTTKWCGGLFLGWITMLILCLASAHLFWKLVDIPVVKVVKQLEKRISI